MKNSKLNSYVWKLAYFVFIFAFCYSFQVFGQYKFAKSGLDYSIKSWNKQNGLPQSSVFAITQTKEGFLWVGTQKGLVRFDGNSFKTFNKSANPEFTDNFVKILLELDNSKLLIVLDDGTILLHKGEIFSRINHDNISFSPRKSPFRTFAMKDSKGVVWLNEGTDILFYIKKEKLFKFHEDFDSTLVSVTENKKGEILIATEKSLYILKDKKTEKKHLSNEIIKSVVSDKFNNTYVALESGLYKLIDNKLKVISKNNIIETLFLDKKGNLWIGGRNTLWMLQKDSENPDLLIEEISSFYARTILSFYEDKFGNMWFGLFDSLNKLYESKFTLIGRQKGLLTDAVSSCYEDVSGNIWVATVKGLSVIKSSGKVVKYFSENIEDIKMITSISGDSLGNIWIGKKDGLYRVIGNKIVYLQGQKKNQGNTVYSIYVLSPGNIIAGCDKGLLRVKNNKLVPLEFPLGQITETVFSICKDSRQTIWLGTDEGIIRIDNKKILKIKAYDNKKVFVVNVVEGKNGVIYFGTNGQGLIFYYHGRYYQLDKAAGFSSDEAYAIVESNNGNLWVSSEDALFKISLSSLNDFTKGKLTKIQSERYSNIASIENIEFVGARSPSGIKTKSGNIYMATTNGLLKIDPNKKLSIFNKNPFTVIKELSAAEKKYNPFDNSFIFPKGTKSVDITYVGIDLSVSKVIYKYKIIGLGNEKWNFVGDETRLFFKNLKPGKYQFQVVGGYDKAHWDFQPAYIDFTILPFFYETKGFYGLTMFVFIMFLYFLYTIRIKRLAENEQNLKKIVEKRTKEVVLEKEKAIIANKTKSQVLHIVAHDLRNPLQGIKGYAELIKMKSKDEYAVKNAGIIEKSSEKIEKMISQFLESESLESGKINMEFEKVDVNEIVSLCLKEQNKKAKAKKQQLRLTVEDDSELYVDKDKFIEIIMNLISNAIKYSEKNKIIEVSIYKENNYKIFSIKDEGLGFTDEDKANLYKQFGRLSASPTDGESSIGLGLSIVKKLVELLNGEIELESQPGKGSTFFVKFKLDEEKGG